MGLDHPLEKIAKHIGEQAKLHRIATVFDLDSTLFCVSTRSQAIVRDLAISQEFAEAHPLVAKLLRELEVLPSDWGVREAIIRALQGQDTANEVDESLMDKVRKHWRKYFFSDDYLHHDVMYPAANDYVRELERLGAEVLYLTGRSQANMRAGTLLSLQYWGFPLKKEENLYMKPNEQLEDEHFKVTVLRQLSTQFDQIWFFENEPVIIDWVRRELPNIQIIFVKTVHSGRANAPDGLLTITGDYKWPRL